MEELNQHQRRKGHGARKRDLVLHDHQGNPEHPPRSPPPSPRLERTRSRTVGDPAAALLGSRGGRFITSGSFGSTANARTQGKSVGDQIDPERMWIGSSGNGQPNNVLPSITSTSLRLHDSKWCGFANVLVDAPAFLDRRGDGRKVIVGYDHVRRVFRASVPVMPMAIPISLPAPQASFTPSPVIATTAPCARQA